MNRKKDFDRNNNVEVINYKNLIEQTVELVIKGFLIETGTQVFCNLLVGILSSDDRKLFHY